MQILLNVICMGLGIAITVFFGLWIGIAHGLHVLINSGSFSGVVIGLIMLFVFTPTACAIGSTITLFGVSRMPVDKGDN